MRIAWKVINDNFHHLQMSRSAVTQHVPSAGATHRNAPPMTAPGRRDRPHRRIKVRKRTDTRGRPCAESSAA